VPTVDIIENRDWWGKNTCNYLSIKWKTSTTIKNPKPNSTRPSKDSIRDKWAI